MNNNTKKKKADRQSLYVTAVVILMMVTVIVAIATSLARNTGEIEDPDDTTDAAVIPSDDPEDTGKEEDTEDVFFGNDEDDETDEGSQSDTKEPQDEDTEKTDADAEGEGSVPERLPEFVSPVIGEVLRDASLEVPVFSSTMEDYRTHSGIDLFCEAGGDVAAAADGTIKEIWDDPMMGTCISIEHSGGAVTVYKNLYEDIPEGIEVGKNVKCGEIIATAGESALLEIAEESHLHFELYVNGVAVDPSDYIEFSTEPVFAD